MRTRIRYFFHWIRIRVLPVATDLQYTITYIYIIYIYTIDVYLYIDVFYRQNPDKKIKPVILGSYGKKKKKRIYEYSVYFKI